MSDHTISFQLYSARNFPPLETVLEGLAKIGYAAVEPYYPLYGDDAAGYAKKVAAVGLSTPTFHAPPAGVIGETDRFIDIAKTIGATTIIVPHIGGDDRPKDLDGWKAFAAKLGEVAVKAKAAGLGLGWHNHDFEFVALPDGSRPIDHLIGHGVTSELDIGWVVRAGKDAAAEIDKFASQTIAFHIKDIAPAGTTIDDGWTNVGDGVVDWKALWPHIEKASNARILVAEHDNPSDWKIFAERSFKAIQALVSGKA